MSLARFKGVPSDGNPFRFPGRMADRAREPAALLPLPPHPLPPVNVIMDHVPRHVVKEDQTFPLRDVFPSSLAMRAVSPESFAERSYGARRKATLVSGVISRNGAAERRRYRFIQFATPFRAHRVDRAALANANPDSSARTPKRDSRDDRCDNK